jgi:hypothetical protein
MRILLSRSFHSAAYGLIDVAAYLNDSGWLTAVPGEIGQPTDSSTEPTWMATADLSDITSNGLNAAVVGRSRSPLCVRHTASDRTTDLLSDDGVLTGRGSLLVTL